MDEGGIQKVNGYLAYILSELKFDEHEVVNAFLQNLKSCCCKHFNGIGQDTCIDYIYTYLSTDTYSISQYSVVTYRGNRVKYVEHCIWTINKHCMYTDRPVTLVASHGNR